MKAVLMSIQPKWVEKIVNGEKTIEVRKSVPKIERPFKCYIYETQGATETPWVDEDGHYIFKGRGRVIGEFVCDEIEPLTEYDLLYEGHYVEEKTRVSQQELLTYKGKNDFLYGWHISDLKIYDKPKELETFYNWKKCNACKETGYESTACCYDIDCKVPAVITRPPQSWCYVEAQE